MPVRLPWHTKIAIKLVLSRLPISYDSWRRVSLFRHGRNDEPAYALDAFERHLHLSEFEPFNGFVALELGPGDSIAGCLIAAAHGASRTHLVDVGNFARTDIRLYQEMELFLRARNLDPPSLAGVSSVDEVLRRCRAEYMTDGLASLGKLPSSSVHFAWSQAVLEHVERDAVDETLSELRRILRDDGTSSHRIDFEDHLEGGLKQLEIR